MSILTQIFGSRQNGESRSTQTPEGVTNPVKDKLELDRRLFVDEIPPVIEPVKNLASPFEKKRSQAELIRAFTESNLSSKGFDAGYKYHSPDLKVSMIREIKSDLQALLRLEIDRLRIVLGELKTQIAVLKHDEMMEAAKSGLETRKSEFTDAILRLQEEVLLAEDGLGLVRKPIDTFTQGFTKGYQLYLTEDLLNQQYGLS